MAKLVRDGKVIAINLPQPTHWVDLYHSWNLAFVIPFAPTTLIAKLLIPGVSGAREVPYEYMYRRILALHATLAYNHFSSKAALSGNKGRVFDNFYFKSIALTKLMGKINKQQAKEYQLLVRSEEGRRGKR